MQRNILINTVKYLFPIILQISLPFNLIFLISINEWGFLIVSVMLASLYHFVGPVLSGHYVIGHLLYRNIKNISKNILFFFQFYVTWITPQYWGAVHIQHHKYHDTQKDPHSPKHQGLRSLLAYYPAQYIDLRTYVKINKDFTANFIDRYFYFLILVPLCIITMIFGYEYVCFLWLIPSSLALWTATIWAYITHENEPLKLPDYVEYIFVGESADHAIHHRNWKEVPYIINKALKLL